MSFFDQFKTGAAELSKKAQITVEKNRLKLRIIEKNKEITSLYERIGQIVYTRKDSLESIHDKITVLCDKIDIIEQEISQIAEEIDKLTDEKQCLKCKHIISADVKFCPSCGTKVEPEIITVEANGNLNLREGKGNE